MNTFQLDCFLAVADYLNFAKAAEQMNISQPAVTHQIQSLENELHVKLFRRTTRSVELTVEGHTFLSDARDIVILSKRALKRFEHADEQVIMDFSIGCTSQAQFHLLPDILKKLTEIYPNLHPRILAVPSAQILSRVEEGAVDIALGLKTDIKKNSLTYRELKKVPAICAFREDHPFAGKTSVTMEDIKPHKLILYHPGSVSLEVLQFQNRLSETKKLSELYFCESEESALILARAGLGIAIMPDISMTDNPDVNDSFKYLKKCKIADAGERSFGYYYKTLAGNAPLKDFIRLLRESVNTET